MLSYLFSALSPEAGNDASLNQELPELSRYRPLFSGWNIPKGAHVLVNDPRGTQSLNLTMIDSVTSFGWAHECSSESNYRFTVDCGP
nr:unnamed protein product [Haemonchus contortus]